MLEAQLTDECHTARTSRRPEKKAPTYLPGVWPSCRRRLPARERHRKTPERPVKYLRSAHTKRRRNQYTPAAAAAASRARGRRREETRAPAAAHTSARARGRPPSAASPSPRRVGTAPGRHAAETAARLAGKHTARVSSGAAKIRLTLDDRHAGRQRRLRPVPAASNRRPRD
ncbi:hypothetical protein R5R35_000838 [Gryllus longicercus]|uniref:Uncharacterized protein n=1 Tax=Gryllus longicercus TaxID=2509291 RepID=A0AAN9V5D5_9ORTH